MADPWQKWFEDIWADREERLYRSFFGNTGPGIYTLTAQTFASLGVKDVDPRFLFHGVFECPPNDLHPDWIYVSSGMSNPWGESPETVKPDGFSGLGLEFTLHTSHQQRWAIELLHWLMAVQLAVAAGSLKGDLLQRGDRVGIGAGIPTREGPGLITHLLTSSSEEYGLAPNPAPLSYPAEFSLASGRVEFLLMLGITERERDFARTQGAEGLITLLRHHGVFPRTDPARASLV